MKNNLFNEHIGHKELVDIHDVCVNRLLSKEERVKEYIKQIKDPYHFRCGDFKVTVEFSNNGLTMEECLRGIIL